MRTLILALGTIISMSSCLLAQAQTGTPSSPRPVRQVAPSPPMGWNSWDVYGTAVTEDQVKAATDAMALHLAPFGWQYVVVDIQWYAPEARGHTYLPGAELTMDEFGRLTPAVNRFPSAAGGMGFKPLADYVHGKGLKFGIHIMRGIPKQAVVRHCRVKGTPLHAADIADAENGCRWNPDMEGVDMTKTGAQMYYNSLAELYASWGVDYVKADDMGSHLYQPAEMKALSLALGRTGRPIILSISPGPAPVSEAAFFERYATMWRISDDFWDEWSLLKGQFVLAHAWAPFVGVNGTWPDADMLPLGRLRKTDPAGRGEQTRFTPDEQRTVMTLWSIFRSPLIFGGDVADLDSATRSLLTNPEVLAVDQKSTGNRLAYEKGDLVVWTAMAPSGHDYYVAAFNTGEEVRVLKAGWTDLGIHAATARVRDVWLLADAGTWAEMHVELRPHASGLFHVTLQ